MPRYEDAGVPTEWVVEFEVQKNPVAIVSNKRKVACYL